MSAQFAATPVQPPREADLRPTGEPVEPAPGAPIEPTGRGGWRTWLGAAISVALLVGVLVQLRHTGPGELGRMLRLSPAFWGVFLALYLAQPISELAIFGRLWGLPVAGLPVLLRKGVINEIVFGYSGEVYFYLWARDRSRMNDAPFGAVKDVNIISALLGNAVTLVMLAIAAPALRSVDLGRYLAPILWSGLAVVALSFAILLFARKVFTLPRAALAMVTGLTVLRLVATTGLTILLWSLALPSVALGVWLALVALRLLVARLPFLTNKDLVFANLAFLMIGRQSQVGALMGTLALMTLMTHVAVIAVLSVSDLVKALRRR